MTSDHKSNTNLSHFYLVGSNPLHNDKIVFTLGTVLNKYPNTGAAGPGTISIYTDSGVPTYINSLTRLYIACSFIDGVFYSDNFKVSPDNYVSNITVLLTY